MWLIESGLRTGRRQDEEFDKIDNHESFQCGLFVINEKLLGRDRTEVTKKL